MCPSSISIEIAPLSVTHTSIKSGYNYATVRVGSLACVYLDQLSPNLSLLYTYRQEKFILLRKTFSGRLSM